MATVTRRKKLSGWGRTEPTVAEVAEPRSADEVSALVKGVPAAGVIARGLGRSYNNAAQNDGGLVISTAGMTDVLSFDRASGVVTCEAGVSLEQLMVRLLPAGWFARHVLSFDLLTADGGVRTVTPQSDAELFWGTAGGMGLTGIILRASVQMKKVDTSRLIVDTVRTADIDETMAYLASTDDDYDYTVAWTDCLATRGSLGRSVITSGDFATIGELRYRDRGQPLAFKPSALIGAPPVFASGLINARTVGLLNEAWFRKAPRRRTGEIQTIGQFFHPLDGIRNWNRVYGPAGFVQYQYVVPFEADAVVWRSLERISALRAPSFVTVLKRFGEGDPGMLSFPMPGWTLALDFPSRTPWLRPLLSELDEMVLEAGGRLYLAKDSRIPAELMPAMYPRYEDFRRLRAKVDPAGVFASDLSRRLDL